MKIEICDETRTTIISSLAVIGLVALVLGSMFIYSSTQKAAFAAGYSEVQTAGATTTMWVKKP